ncbi:hypothetical protein CDAR_474381 [Caerostris darwini]|uniref:Uncharacterized protein n=1 Tax=Caerostris darwini TaxID=1538125 RepID=A0AAV4M5H1_9ARAC|nr:hypothetical protein CDAR_474381 [Caerostris darwini]
MRVPISKTSVTSTFPSLVCPVCESHGRRSHLGRGGRGVARNECTSPLTLLYLLGMPDLFFLLLSRARDPPRKRLLGKFWKPNPWLFPN